jgi:hypothetical protein
LDEPVIIRFAFFGVPMGSKIPFCHIAAYSLYAKWKDRGVICVMLDNSGYFKNPRCLMDNIRGSTSVRIVFFLRDDLISFRLKNNPPVSRTFLLGELSSIS